MIHCCVSVCGDEKAATVSISLRSERVRGYQRDGVYTRERLVSGRVCMVCRENPQACEF